MPYSYRIAGPLLTKKALGDGDTVITTLRKSLPALEEPVLKSPDGTMFDLSLLGDARSLLR